MPAVDRFTQYAKNHPELKFMVTPVGCGIAVYAPKDIAPMFRTAAYLENVYFSSSFWGEYEKSAIWFKNSDGNWTTSSRRYFNMS